MIEGGKLTSQKPDPSKKWSSQTKNIRKNLIPSIIKKLPGYKQHSGAIENILKSHHKTQRRTAKINSDDTLKAYNLARIGKNSKVNEKRKRRRRALSFLMKAGNEDIVRYPRDDLERFTTNEGGNAYQSAEEWVTDEEATKRDGKDGKKK